MKKQAGRRKQHELKAKAAICGAVHPGQPCPLPKKAQTNLRHGVGTMEVKK